MYYFSSTVFIAIQNFQGLLDATEILSDIISNRIIWFYVRPDFSFFLYAIFVLCNFTFTVPFSFIIVIIIICFIYNLKLAQIICSNFKFVFNMPFYKHYFTIQYIRKTFRALRAALLQSKDKIWNYARQNTCQSSNMSCVRRRKKNCCYISYTHVHRHEYVPDFEKKKNRIYYTIMTSTII